jgi:hypothetical protein
MKLTNEVMFSEGNYDCDINYEMNLYRIWLRRRSELYSGETNGLAKKSKDLAPQKIKFEDFAPDIKSPELKAEKEGREREINESQFETLDDLVRKINDKIKNEEIGGRILNVQTIKCPADDNWEFDGQETDPKTSGKYIFLLRVFYEVGPPGDSLVGLADFIPQHISGGGLFSWPKFETQKEVLAKLSSWISENPEIIFCNAQTVDILLISSK